MSVIGGRYKSLRDVKTPLSEAARVGYAPGREDDLTETAGVGYSINADTPRRPPEKTLAPATPPPSLPGWLSSVAGLWPDDPAEWPGAVVIARCRSTSEKRVADLLAERRVSYYLPSEPVDRRYEYPVGKPDEKGDRRIRVVRRRYYRSRFPGMLVVGDGIRGYEAARHIGSQHRSTVWGFITVSAASAARFRKQLIDLSVHLARDPDLKTIRGIVPGRRARVIAGPFMGAEGVLDAERPDHRFAIVTPVFGRSTLLEVPLDHLEVIDDGPDA